MRNSYHKKINIQCYQCGCSGYCCCSCSDKPSRRTFFFYKLDRNTKEGLPGAVFQLKKKDFITDAVSDISGKTEFKNIELGEYTLHEITAPQGYIKDSGTYSVILHQDGVTIDNMPAEEFIISDCKTGSSTYLIYKENLDGYSGETLIQNVASGSMQTLLPNVFDGIENEFVAWNTDPYLRGHSYHPGDEIVIGCKFVLYAAWKSNPPTDISVSKETAAIRGKGISRSRIDLQFPKGIIESTIVKACGDWTIDVPASSLPLLSGAAIKVFQTEFNMYKSEPVTVIVPS